METDNKTFICRLCQTTAMDRESVMFDKSSTLTKLGKRLAALLSLQVEDIMKLHYFCCQQCDHKINNCFELLMEIQFSVMDNRITVENRALVPNLMKYLSMCCKLCGKEMYNMKDFCEHFDSQCTKVPNNEFLPKNETLLKDYVEKNAISKSVSKKKHKKEKEKNESLMDEKNIGPNENTSQLNTVFSHNTESCKENTDTKINNDISLELKKAKNKKLKKHVCKTCSGVFANDIYKTHSIECKSKFLTDGNILCHYCGKTILGSLFTSHMYSHKINNGSQTCKICKKSLISRKSLQQHMTIHDESKHLICEVCGEKIRPYLLWKHRKKHKVKENKCNLCDRAYTYKYMLKTHIKRYHSDSAYSRRSAHGTQVDCSAHNCPHCDMQFTYISMLDSHMKEEHGEVLPEMESNFACEMCKKSFDDQYSLRNHLLLFHNVTKEEVSKMKTTLQRGAFQCSLCKATLQSEYGLRKHLRTVHDLQNTEMPNSMRRKCEKCDKVFADKACLTQHINAVHLNVDRLCCELCGRKFTRYQGLVYHRLMHLGKKPFECEVCSKSYRQRIDVIRHLQRHVRDGEVSLENASAKNNNPSGKLRKCRIFLKDSAIYASIEKDNSSSSTSSEKPK